MENVKNIGATTKPYSLSEQRRYDAAMPTSQDTDTNTKNEATSIQDPPSRDAVNSVQSKDTATLEGLTKSNLLEAVKALEISIVMPSAGRDDSDVAGKGKAPIEQSSENASLQADSASDLGTKPLSLDGKSITSGTTFALDEKESLRPDDSASVQAAEDDEALSGPGSIAADSRISSEVAGRAFRSQLPDATERRSIAVQAIQLRQVQDLPQSLQSVSDQQLIQAGKGNSPTDFAESPMVSNIFYRQTPDDKLLEALESPKDRIFLLRLEQTVIEFVKDSKYIEPQI